MAKHLEWNLLLPNCKKTFRNKKARDKLLMCPQNFNKSNGNKTLSISDKISQADQHTKALQKSSKLKNKFRQLAVRQTFQTNLDNFYYLLKDEHVLFFYLLHSLSSTSRLKIQKLCHNPTKTTKCPQLSRQLTTSQCNCNTVHALTTYPTHPKFSKAIILKLSQKTTPQVKRPVCLSRTHACKQNTCT